MRTYPGYSGTLRRFVFAQVCALSILTGAWAQEAKTPDQNPPPQENQNQNQNQPASPTTAPASQTQTAPAATTGSQSPVYTLSPFEVKSSQATGYYTPTTLAGTRLNNKISDLASSITIVTKQMMEDTNSENLNDVFRYEANTEGASTYTPVSLVRGNVADVLGTRRETGGNRVRGLSSADLQVDNFFSIDRIPFDSYNTASLEVDRGPNSILFGTGSPAGIVNQSRERAQTDKERGSVSLRVGSWGAFRETIDLNVPVIKDRLAIRVAQAYTSQGFMQKPSYDNTRRQYAAFTFVPFRSGKTKIVGSYEYYNRSADDPNAVTPVDFVTPWRENGRPVWDPTTTTVTYLNGGQTVGPYLPSTSSTGYVGYLQSNLTNSSSSQFIPTLTYVSTGGHIVRAVNPDNSTSTFFKSVQHGFTDNPVPSPMSPAQEAVYNEVMTWSAGLPYPSGYQIWQYPGVTSKSVYDWSKININAMNKAKSSAKTYYAELTQELLPNLHLDIGWLRQEYKENLDEPVSQANATTIYVDTNTKLMDGSVNPHFGQALIDTYASDQFINTETNNNYRASLEYELDLKKHVPDWMGWLGHHRLMFVVSQHEDIQNNLRYRESIVGGDPNYLPSDATFNRDAGYGYPLHNTAIEQWFYLEGNGAANGFGMSAPGTLGRPPIAATASGPSETGNAISYIYDTGMWTNSTFDMQSLLFPTGGLQQNVQDSKTYFWQGFLWNDRIVTTVGLNQEKIKNRQNVFPSSNPESFEYTNGYPNTQYWNNYGPWVYNSGRTWTKGLVVHPFQQWAKIDQAADNGNLLAGIARTLSFTFNDSANFNPPPAAYTDFFGNALGQPSGTERDYGIEIATPDHKLYVRATWFKTTNQNQLISNTSNARALYIDANELKAWATAVVQVRSGQDPTSSDFGDTNIYPITAAMQDQISALTGLPYNFGGNVGENGQFINPHETENGVARGIELEAIYNPLPNWRIKFSWGKQRTIISNIAAQAAAWVNYRLPTWQTYTAPDITQVYTRSNGRQMSLSNFWTGYGYDNNIYQGQAFGWNTTQDYYDVVVAAQLATDRALNNTQATNQRVYTWSLVSSYDFINGPFKDWTVGGAVRYLGRAVAGYYGDTTNLSPSGDVFQPDTNKPIYYPAKYHFDAWVAYKFKLPFSNGRIHASVQLNVADIGIHSHLEPVTFNYDGSPAAERIIQPTTYSLSTKFSF